MEKITENNIAIAKMLGYKDTTFEFKMSWLGLRFSDDLVKIDEDKIPILEKDNDYLFTDTINYDNDWNELITAVEFINSTHNADLIKRDLSYTISYLLNEGYKFESEKIEPWLPLTLENLFLRVSDFAKYYNNKINEEKI